MQTHVINGTEYRIHNGKYAISRDGHILRLSDMSTYKPPIRKDGYATIGRKMLLHRAVAILWLDQPENAKHVHHKNHNKLDNRAENLEWVTPKQHRHFHGKTLLSHSEETKQRLREKRLGTTLDEKTRKKISSSLRAIGHKPPSWKGKKHLDKTREKMSRNHGKSQKCEVDGVVYPSFSAAARNRGEKPLSLRKRCLSDRFPNYQIL